MAFQGLAEVAFVPAHRDRPYLSWIQNHVYDMRVPRKSVAASTRGTAIDADSKSARTRARILDAAAHVLSAKGFAGTRLSDVAEYAELQAPAIYYYFGSREELIEEVMYCGIADLRQHVQESLNNLPPETSPLDRIMTAVEAHLRHELEISDYATASIRNSGQIPQHLRARQLKEEASYGRVWRRLFDNAKADGQIRSDIDLRFAQLLVLGALNWAAEWRDPRRDSVDNIVATAQSLIRHGLNMQESPQVRGARKARTSTAKR
ncbi:TetR family transcriptional regulator [Mycobacterium kiyosense]|uniref:TetR family transcriptional regulator n=2 Tax=Mycobacteriaceae TaxID=1762 RepID=A0A9P3Q4G8_9MYCO|nr:TetR family transcriptional regulator [Mycobacterium sp. 20KCMC460]GLB81104.1 TetR family transcriptional regulator [Mycobacterium kiyosense]GLB90413.1 TetR family transcriptional regulator [Mycobacterium kiyosense]GLB93585.1 TetR family transcriptional regulator [Mycobacterium kiyosense]GLB99814.1 TetR family transcriptional regulator [Mycobacterium kiyosense]